jgi:hypothetical protein
MRSGTRYLIILGLALMLMGTATTFGDDDLMNIRVYNDTSDEIVVTVYDMNATPPGPVLLHQRIDGFAWFPAMITRGVEGHGHVRWTAITAGGGFHSCGHQERRGLKSDAMVHVFTDSTC